MCPDLRTTAFSCSVAAVWPEHISYVEVSAGAPVSLVSAQESGPEPPGYTLDLESRAKGIFLQMLEQCFFAVKCSDQEQRKILAVILSCMKMCQAKNRWGSGDCLWLSGSWAASLPAQVGAE